MQLGLTVSHVKPVEPHLADVSVCILRSDLLDDEREILGDAQTVPVLVACPGFLVLEHRDDFLPWDFPSLECLEKGEEQGREKTCKGSTEDGQKSHQGNYHGATEARTGFYERQVWWLLSGSRSVDIRGGGAFEAAASKL